MEVEKRSRIMRAVKKRDTSPELQVRRSAGPRIVSATGFGCNASSSLEPRTWSFRATGSRFSFTAASGTSTKAAGSRIGRGATPPTGSPS